MILGPNGLPARHSVVALSSAAIRALVDGRAFASELDGALRAAAVEPYCLRCVGAGGDGRIHSTLHDDRVDWRCAHRAGWISRSKPSDVEPLLQQLGWGVRCTACHDGVTGDNGKQDATFRVTCGCTVREKANPVALAGVGRG